MLQMAVPKTVMFISQSSLHTEWLGGFLFCFCGVFLEKTIIIHQFIELLFIMFNKSISIHLK